MANFAIHRPGRPVSALEGVPANIIAGYGLGKDMRDRRTNREYAEALAAEPQAGEGIPTDTQQTDMLQEQTAEFADETGALPTQEVEAQESTQKPKRLTTQDWALWRQDLVEKAAATGDPAKVREASAYVTQTQHTGFMKNLDMASSLIGADNLQGAIKYLEDANEFMPNGSTTRFRVADGNIVAESFDEATGEPRGMMAFNKDNINKYIENLRDPQKFAYWNFESKYKDADAARADKRLAIDRGRMALEGDRLAIAENADIRAEQADMRAQAAFEEDRLRGPLKDKKLAAEVDATKALAEQRRSAAQKADRWEARWGGSKGFTTKQKADAKIDILAALRELEFDMENGVIDPDEGAYRKQQYEQLLDDINKTPTVDPRGRQSGGASGPAKGVIRRGDVPKGAKFSAASNKWYAEDGSMYSKEGKLLPERWK